MATEAVLRLDADDLCVWVGENANYECRGRFNADPGQFVHAREYFFRRVTVSSVV